MDLRPVIQSAIAAFTTLPFESAADNLWKAIGYSSQKKLDIPTDPETFYIHLATIADNGLSIANSHVEDWISVHFLFQLTNDEIPSLSRNQLNLNIPDVAYRKGIIESFVFVAIELKDIAWTRTQFAQITRELNRGFPMPVTILFKHGRSVSIGVIDRRVNRRDAGKTVIDSRKVSIVKDIDIDCPHRAHIEILNDLAFANVGERTAPSNFRDLYEAWIRVLSVKELNKKFYDELLTWYLWAIRLAKFPKGQVPDREGLPSVAVIRLLTRLIFVWFVREKGVVPDELFRNTDLDALLNEPPSKCPDSSSYYKAILQNLFFATLNTEAADRRWKYENNGGLNSHYLVHSVYRYKDLFKDSEHALSLFTNVPFLNGGLFECLDRELSARDLEKNPELEALAAREGNGFVLRVDGFSGRATNELFVPNRLFFSDGEDIDLNTELGTKGKKRTARGLVDIFSRYKFTIEENTPIEEEIALDPELLGKVFENLLASYNEDTKTTARKLSGSFYTPRVVVDYMVDEALLAHFETHLKRNETIYDLATKLRQLLSFGGTDHDFTPHQVVTLISSIEHLRALDLACGSGAFLMGMLQKLVHVLAKLDPNNTLWKEQNRKPLARQLIEAAEFRDPVLRETRTEEATDALVKLDISFSDKHYSDYSRKLYLIEKCLFGVDIQPIAVQIAKLRFFISLVVSQRSAAGADNSNITALPNLETKLVAANSLVPIERPHQITLRDIAIDDKEEDLRLANERHFAARTTRTKRKYRDMIADLRDNLAVLLEQDRLLTSDSAKQVVQWNPFDQNGSALFFDPEWMFGLNEGFDIVIGNPPYVRHENIKEQKPGFQRTYASYAGTADLYVYFYERSIKLLKPGGAFAFITSNKWYRANYGEKLRVWMNQNTLLRRIIDFGDEAVFEAMAYPTIVIATKRNQEFREPQDGDNVVALNWETGSEIDDFPKIFAERAFSVPQAGLSARGWQIERSNKRDLLTRIAGAGKPLGEWCDGRLYRGVVTGSNEAFVIDGSQRAALICADAHSEELIKRYLRGRDIKRWHVEPQDLWLIFTRRGIDIDAFPAVKSYLEAFTTSLTPKPSSWPKGRPWQGRKAGSYEWYEIQDNIAYWEEFAKPKIIYPDIATEPRFVYDTEGYFVGNTGYMFPASDPWVLGVLNSPVSAWYYRETSAQIQGGYFRFFTQYISQVRIPDATDDQKAAIRTLVNMLSGEAQISPRWHRLLNGLVYELFFADDMKSRGMRLFDEVKKIGLHAGNQLSVEQAAALVTGLLEQESVIFRNDHAIYRILFDLQAIPAIRIIEGKE